MAKPPEQRTCGTMEVHEKMLRSVPGYIEARSASETRAFQYANRMIAAQRTGVTVIPVVVHVVWKTADQNISDAQVQSQIDVLNKDYRKANPDLVNLPAVFQALAADARIEFQLASTDPGGAATNGITRTQTTSANFIDDNKVKAAATGGIPPWDTTKYLNLWVCELGNGLLGYAQFPGGPAATDGVVILNSAFGTVGTATAFAPYNLGRTASHEIGHWLNLRHIWGDDGNGCSGDDLVADTPNAAGPNFGKPAFPHVTCANGPNGDLFQNYMDYTDDAAMFMFTSGQVARMQACLDGDRSTIGHTKIGPTISVVDVHPTAFVSDVHPTIAAADFATLAAADTHPTIVTADVHPTIAAVDFATLAATDTHPTIVTADVHPTSAIQDLTIAVADTHPTLITADTPQTVSVLDHGPTIAIADIGIPNQGWPQGPGPGPGPERAMPFVLATPHHTMAWTQSFPDMAQSRAATLLNQISQYEGVLQQLGDAERAGNLSAVDAVAAEQVGAEYERLKAEYRQLVGV